MGEDPDGDSPRFADTEVHPPSAGSNPLSASTQHGPPPAYESLMLTREDISRETDAGNLGQGAAPQAAPRPQQALFDITVMDPIKLGDGVGAYVSYRVRTRTNAPGYSSSPEAIRRFRDFAWLHDQLHEHYKGIIIPPVPEKSVIQKYQQSTDFISQRQQALNVFVNRVAAHPDLQRSPQLRAFLESSEQDWATEQVRTGGGPGGGAKKTLAGAVQLFRDLGASAASSITGRNDELDEDPQYLQMRDYIASLETHVGEAHRQATRLVKRQAVLGSSLNEFGRSMVALGKFEEGALAESFMAMGEKAVGLAHHEHEQARKLVASFEAPFKEFVRLVRSARQTMGDRSTALATLHGARAVVDSKRSKLNKLRGIPGIVEEKVSEVERELNDAQHRVEAAKGAYELIVSRMAHELPRFQRERAQEMAAVLREYAAGQAQSSDHSARVWRQLVPVHYRDNDANR